MLPYSSPSGGKNRVEKCLACKTAGEDGFPVSFPYMVYLPPSLCPDNITPIPSAQALKSTACHHT